MIKELKIKIVYSGNEFFLNIFPSHSNYDSLVRDVQKKISVDKSIRLMTVNTKERYQILTKKNIGNIFIEEIDGPLILYVTDIEEEEDKEYKENNDLEFKNDDNSIDEDDKDFKDDSFEMELQKEKNKNRLFSFREISKIKGTLDKSDPNEKKDQNEGVALIKSPMENRHKNTMVNIKISNNLINRKKETDLKSDKISSVKMKPISLHSDNKISSYNMESLSQNTCSICNLPLDSNKYICCICDNKILCDKCEENHGHPTFKYKSQLLFSLGEIYNYLGAHKDLKTPLPKMKSPKFTYDILIGPNLIEFTMRPDKTLNLHICIANNSNKNITPNVYTLLIKNQQNITLSYDQSSLNITKKTKSLINIIVHSGAKLCHEEITLELYSTTAKIKDNKCQISQLQIEVNDDLEEEDLNCMFKNNCYCKLFPKQKKMTIRNIIQEGLSLKTPEEIATILSKNKWVIENAIKELTTD